MQRNYWALFWGVLILSVFVFYAFDLKNRGLDIPLVYQGDAIHSLLVAKSIIVNGWWWQVPQLSYPSGALELVSFPVLGQVDTIFFKLISIYSDSPFVIVNFYFYLSIFLAYFSSYFSFRMLNLTQVTSSIAAVAFAVLPQIYFRNISHLMLVHYLVPIVIISCIYIYDASLFEKRQRQLQYVLYGGLFLLGLNYIYTSFFGLFFMICSFLFRCIKNAKFKIEKVDWLFFGAVFFGVFLNLAPTIYFWKTHLDISQIINSFKLAAEADMYGLKLRHLFQPSDSHFLFKAIGQKFTAQPFPLENENYFSKLGTASLIGFIYINYKAIVATMRNSVKSVENRIEFILFLLIYVAFLLASIGGVGSVFNTLISPSIRCYNRISPFLGFIFLIGFSMLLDVWFKDKMNKKNMSKYLVATFAMVFVAFDEFQPAFSDYKPIKDEMSIQKQIITDLESKGSEVKILQIPYTNYPHTPKINNMESNDHLKAYLFSNGKSYFSWPTFHVNKFYSDLNINDKEISKQILQYMRENRFNVLWFNLKAFKPEDIKVIESLSSMNSSFSEVFKNDLFYVYSVNMLDKE